MGELVTFVPNRKRTAAANVAEFVNLCRHKLKVFGADLDFDSLRWDATAIASIRGTNGLQRLVFSQLGERSKSRARPMREPFCSFAKAYLRYRYGLRPSTNFSSRIQAVRALEMALAGAMVHPSVHLTTPAILDEAADLLRGHFAPHGAYSAGMELEALARFLDEYALVATPLTWTSPTPRPKNERLGPEFERRRRKKLPSRAALNALGDAFNRATEPRDVIVTAAAAIQFCTNSRICEVLTIPAHCEVASIRHGDKIGLGLRWWPAKGGPPGVKWLLPMTAPIARLALGKLRATTGEARKMARWYERNPRRLYLPRHLEHLRHRELLNSLDAAAITGFTRARPYVRGLPSQTIKGWKWFRFADLEAKILAGLPPGFPIYDRHSGLPFSEALFAIPKGLFASDRAPIPCMMERVTQPHINKGLGGQSRRYPGYSVFARMGLTEPDGSPIRLPSHNLRHYVSDMAQRNEVSEEDQAAWGGRKHPKDNRAYSHMSDGERLDHVRAMLRSRDTWRGPQSEIAEIVPVERSTFSKLSAPTIHSTEIGYCIHHFAMLPCRLHRDCLFCTEHVCIKGDNARRETVRRWLTENVALLAQARKALSRRAFGADRWAIHTRAAVQRLRELLALLDDRAIPDGTIIQLASPNMPSRIREAMEERAALGEHQVAGRLPARSRRKRRHS